MFLLLLNLFIPSGKVPAFLKLSSAHVHIMGVSMQRRSWEQNPTSQKHQHTWGKTWDFLTVYVIPGVVLGLKSGNSYACLNLKANMCMPYAFPTNLSLSQPLSFLTFPLPVLSPVLLVGK